MGLLTGIRCVTSNRQSRRLLRAAAPIPGESLRGLVADACARNHISNTWGMLQHFGLPHRNRVDLSESGDLKVTELATALGVDERDVSARRYPLVGPSQRSFYGLRLNANRIENHLRRFSPAAISDRHLHHLAVHELRDVPFSPVGWDILQSSCPCEPGGLPQRWVRVNGTARCDGCGGRLDRIEPLRVPEGLRGALSLLGGIVDPEEGARDAAMAMLPHEIRATDRTMLFDVIITIGRALTPAAGSAVRYCEGLVRSCEAVMAWPNGLAGLGSSPSNNQNWDVARRNYLLLDTCTENSQKDQQLSAGDTHIKVPSRALYIPQGACGRIESPFVSGLAAARVAGVDEHALKQAWDDGLLTQHLSVLRGERVRAFDPEEVRSLAPRLRRSKARTRVAALLGITAFGVEQLAALKLFQPQAPAAAQSQWDVHRTEAERLISTLKDQASEGVQEPVRLSDAVRLISGRAKPWGPIFEKLSSAEIPYSYRDIADYPLVRRILISADHLPMILSAQFDRSRFVGETFEEKWSQKDALDCVNGYENAPELLQNLISYATRPKLYLAKDVEMLASSGVTTSDLARRSALSVTRTFMILEKAGVPQIAPGLWARGLAEPLFLN